MAEDLKLSDAMIEKEKGPVSSEINMILDDPQTIAMDQTVRTLFNVKSPADELVGGSVKHIRNLTSKDVKDYYNKYYTPDNTNIVITGDIDPDEAVKLVAKNFTSHRQPSGKKYEEKLSPLQKTIRKDFISDSANSAEIVLGFSGAKNNDAKENILMQIAQNYIFSHSIKLGQKLNDLNTSFHTDQEKISTNPNNPKLLYLAATTSEDKVEDVLKTIFDTINNIKPIDNQELDRIKNCIKSDRKDCFEYSIGVNSVIGNAVLNNNIEYVTKFDEILDSIKTDDVNKAVKKYFNLNRAAISIVHPANNNSVTFKGNKSKKPINENKISQITTTNNFNIGFYNTNSDSIAFNIDLKTDFPNTKNACVRNLLQEIYKMGTSSMTEDELKKYKEERNIRIGVIADSDGFQLDANTDIKNYKDTLKLAKEIIYNPRLTQENFEKAKDKIKDNLMRLEDSSELLYYNYISESDPHMFSTKEEFNALETVTLDDVKEFHKKVLNNSRGVITSNLPLNHEDEVKQEITHFACTLPDVIPNNPQIDKVYIQQQKPVVLTKQKNTSQADVQATYNFKCENTIKEKIVGNLMNSILSSSSIGLFDVLREKQNLAYSVHSGINCADDRGEISLKILTTTDNKATGERSFENLQKSIDGFHNQINALVNGEFTDKDLENAKLAYKAGLLNKEGYSTKVDTIRNGLNSIFGIDYYNQLYAEIDSITKEDIMEFAQKVFSQKPVYAICATQDTLDYNKNYLESLKTL